MDGIPALNVFGQGFVVRRHQRHMLDVERSGELEEGHDRGVAEPPLQIAQILLGEAGALGELLLTEALLEPDPPHISSDQSPNVHSAKLDHYPL